MNQDLQKNTKNTSQTSNYRHLEALSEKIRENIELVLDKLYVPDYNIEYDQVVMPCPIHGGDNKQACCIFIGERAYVVNWKCFTHHCESEYNSGIFGFVQGRLSVLQDRKVSKGESIKWCEELFDMFSGESDNGYSEIVRQNRINQNIERGYVSVKKELIKNKLVMNVPYYKQRGFSQEFLDRYDVGICIDKHKPLYNRIVVPVFDSDYQNYVGSTARTTYNKCPVCKYYHPTNVLCPKTKLEQYKYSKWINSPGFNSELFFYNTWFAKSKILETQTVVLVEGQEDVWRIVNSGIENVLGSFGSSLSDFQKRVLEQMGVLNIVHFGDPDEAGRNFAKQVRDSLGQYYNIYIVESNKDPADHSELEIQKILNPILERFK